VCRGWRRDLGVACGAANVPMQACVRGSEPEKPRPLQIVIAPEEEAWQRGSTAVRHEEPCASIVASEKTHTFAPRYSDVQTDVSLRSSFQEYSALVAYSETSRHMHAAKFSQHVFIPSSPFSVWSISASCFAVAAVVTSVVRESQSFTYGPIVALKGAALHAKQTSAVGRDFLIRLRNVFFNFPRFSLCGLRF